MDDALGVAVLDAGGDALHHEPRLRLGQTPAGVDVVQEVAVVSHLQHEVDLPRRLHETMEAEDVPVTEASECVHLARQELFQELARSAVLLYDLDGDLQQKRISSTHQPTSRNASVTMRREREGGAHHLIFALIPRCPHFGVGAGAQRLSQRVLELLWTRYVL